MTVYVSRETPSRILPLRLPPLGFVLVPGFSVALPFRFTIHDLRFTDLVLPASRRLSPCLSDSRFTIYDSRFPLPSPLHPGLQETPGLPGTKSRPTYDGRRLGPPGVPPRDQGPSSDHAEDNEAAEEERRGEHPRKGSQVPGEPRHRRDPRPHLPGNSISPLRSIISKSLWASSSLKPPSMTFTLSPRPLNLMSMP